jgi:hypothetical protein
MFYTYRQNNSGGRFCGPEYVIVEANNADDANYFAAKYCDIYFNGVQKNEDCECCGDRWSEKWYDEKGDNEPLIYDNKPEEYRSWSGKVSYLIRYADGSAKKSEEIK